MTRFNIIGSTIFAVLLTLFICSQAHTEPPTNEEKCGKDSRNYVAENMGACFADGKAGSAASQCRAEVQSTASQMLKDCLDSITNNPILKHQANPNTDPCVATNTCQTPPGPPKPKPTPPIAKQTDPTKPTDPAIPDPSKPPSTGGSGKDDPAAAQAEASSDIAACGSASAQAVRCCGNPQSCVTGATTVPGSTSSTGIVDACQQAKQLGTTSADLNSRLSTACATPYYSCTSNCDSLLSKYRSLQSSCSGCASQSVYDDTVNQLSSSRSACSNLQGRVMALGNQAIEGAGGNAQGNACNQASSLNPASQGGDSNLAQNNPSNDPNGCAANPSSPGCQSCAQNPNSAACQALAQAEKHDTGTAGFQSAKAKQDPSGFNPADTSTAQPGGPLFGQAGAQPQANSQAGVVPNNSGGAIPGSGSSGPGAQLDSGSRGARGLASSSSVTDIMQGERSGGYTQPASNGSGLEGDDNGNNQAYRGQKLANAALGPSTLDLKNYLPGGSRDPSGGRLGGIWGSREINGQGEDLFKLITAKMNEKCKLGILWQCQP